MPAAKQAARFAGTLALFLAALTLALGLSEAGFRLAGYGAIYDVYSKPSLFWRYDPLLGWSHEPGAQGSYVGPRPFPIEFEAPIEINSLGLRGPEVGERAPFEYRVLVLGDSVAVGFEVAYEDSFVALLEKDLQRRLGVPVRVINGAVRGYGTDQIYLYYRERGRKLEPDLVLLIQSGNDPNDNMTLHRMRRPFGKPAFALREDGSLELVGQPAPRYPLCSAWMLDAAYRPQRVDGPAHRALCFLQTRLADRSALFSFVSSALSRLPSLVYFLKNLSYPSIQLGAAEQEGPRRAVVLSLPAKTARAAGGGADVAEAESRLTTALLLHLAREVWASGASFFVVATPRHLEKLDADALVAAGIDIRQISAPPGVTSELLHFKNDGHYNERGHVVLAWGLRAIVEGYARASREDLRSRGERRFGPGIAPRGGGAQRSPRTDGGASKWKRSVPAATLRSTR